MNFFGIIVLSLSHIYDMVIKTRLFVEDRLVKLVDCLRIIFQALKLKKRYSKKWTIADLLIVIWI
jgi:hypothetical protein